MLPSRCSSLQPQEELQVGSRPRHRITFAAPEIASTKSEDVYFVVFFFVSFAGVVLFLSATFVSFLPAVPLYALL